MRYQKIHAQIWHDEKFIALSGDAQMLFFYLLTSPHSNSIGIYVVPKPYIIADLKWDDKRLAKPFGELLREGLILYDNDVRLVCIPNHCKHNPLENENQTKAAIKILSSLPKSPLYSSILELFRKPFHKRLRELLAKQYAKPEAVAVAVTEEETEEETEEVTEAEEEKILSGKPDCVDEVVSYLNTKLGTSYKATSRKTTALIQARVNEGFTLEEFKTVINTKALEWQHDERMAKFLRPETLFGSKFESYLNQPVPGKGLSTTTAANLAAGQVWLEKDEEDISKNATFTNTTGSTAR